MKHCQNIKIRSVLVCALTALLISVVNVVTVVVPVRADVPAEIRLYPVAAAAYSAQRKGVAVLIYQNDKLLLEQYQNGWKAAEPHLLASGTKSFSCAIAISAVNDKLLTLDEKVADTITEWKTDPARNQITIRELLSLTAGFAAEKSELPATSDRYAISISPEAQIGGQPGARFIYSPVNFYIFGELMNRKLAALTPFAAAAQGTRITDYLQARVFDPIGISTFAIRTDSATNPNLAGGGLLTAQDWARYGKLIMDHGSYNGVQVLDGALLDQCFIGTNANPYYGLTFWLEYDLISDTTFDMKNYVELERMSVISPVPGDIPSGVTLGITRPQVIIAAGAGKQRLFILPEQRIVVVRFGVQDRQWSDAEFLKVLFGSA